MQRQFIRMLIVALLAAPLAFSLAHAQDPEAAVEAPAESDATTSDESATTPAADQAGDSGEPAVVAPDVPPPGERPAAEAFGAVFGQWRDLLTRMGTLQAEYTYAEENELPGIEAEFNQLIEQGRALIPQLREAALAAYVEAPNQDRQVSNFLYDLLQDDVQKSRFESAAQIAQTLIDNEYDSTAIYNMAGVSYFVLNDFDNAQQYLEQAQELGSLDSDGALYLEELEETRQLWAQEQELRAAEAEADDLPQVVLHTSVGDITLELFENEAPQTVGNFVHLVEDGFYDNTVFHRVIPQFMAQGGDPEGTGQGGPGYRIYDETDQPNARMHFCGSVSMANSGLPDSGGSQFFLCMTPRFNLNGKHTVFGRIVDGLDVLSDIQRIGPESGAPEDVEPTQIISAEVIRKRDHEYTPRPVQ